MQYLKKLLFFICLIFVFNACNNKGPSFIDKEIDPGFSAYIASYSGGILSSESTIRIRINDGLIDKTRQKELVEGIIACKPHIEGQTVWSAANTIELIPDEPLKSGQRYEVKLALNKIIETEEAYSIFSFSFDVIQQSMMLSGFSTRTLIAKGEKAATVSASLFTADYANPEKIEECVEVSYQNKEVVLLWDHDQGNKKHSFTTAALERKPDDGLLLIQWDATPIGGQGSGTYKADIPGTSNFKMVSIQAMPKPDNYIYIELSDSPDPNQQTEGLIRLQDGPKLRFEIDNNRIKAYPMEETAMDVVLLIDKSLRNSSGISLTDDIKVDLRFESLKPELRWLGEGVILPESGSLTVPFQAVNLKAVDLKVIKIFASNIPQFLQDNQLDEHYSLKRVGRPVFKKRIDLISDEPLDYGKWNTFSLDLSELTSRDAGAIYHLELDFRKAYSCYPCADDKDADEDEEEAIDYDKPDPEMSYWDNAESYYYSDDYYGPDWWENRDNPCHHAYYNGVEIQKNLLASNLGVIAKMGDEGLLHIIVSDVLSTDPVASAEAEAYDYQQQSLGKARTDEQGFAQISCGHKPYLLVVSKGKERAYLRVNDGNSLSLSRFDVDGQRVQQGLKGYIYGERDVWRPGDSLHLGFILQSDGKDIPAEHPLLMELYDPRGKLAYQQLKNKGEKNITTFSLCTSGDDPTGSWRAKLSAGGAVFSKRIRIESIRPNRLSVKLSADADTLYSGRKAAIDIHAKWLNGAIADGLKVETEVSLTAAKTHFAKWPGYQFFNEAIDFEAGEFTRLEGILDDDGHTKFIVPIPDDLRAPGMLRAGFTNRIYENSGEFSINHVSIPLSPYKHYLGMKLPEGDAARGMLLTDKDHSIQLLSVNQKGDAVDIKNVKLKIYKLDWQWWWESGNSQLASFISSTRHTALYEKSLSTVDGKAETSFRIEYPEWGRYLVYAYIPGGHGCAQVVYVDWPGWAGRAGRENPEEASLISLAADKKEYAPGEKAYISFPGAENGRALICLENGSSVIKKEWIKTTEGENKWSFECTAEMLPNIYVHMHLIQPHAQSINDLPIRLYGVLPLKVSDPGTRLMPVIKAENELRSQQEASIHISEENGNEMDYTLAIVDQGLLGLTNFKTPDPWTYFFSREALGIKTWDMYNELIGASTASLQGIFAIGGDEFISDEENKRTKRFKAVVKYLGPFRLEKNAIEEHIISLPEYNGAVRIMVVAANDMAYGSAEKNVIIADPLMVEAALPRVLSPGDEVNMALTLFAMKDNIRTVNLNIKAIGDVSISRESLRVEFTEPGEKTVLIPVRCGKSEGDISFIIDAVAEGVNEKARRSINIRMRNPNPLQRDLSTYNIPPGTHKELAINIDEGALPLDMGMEVASIRPLAWSSRMDYLLRFPHSCLEQQISAAFPQLYMPLVMDVTDKQKEDMQQNLLDCISHMRSFQQASGAMSIWPSPTAKNNEWLSAYAAHFLVEADDKGYTVAGGMKESLLKYLKSMSSRWSADNDPGSSLTQAYRLYVLALAGQPDMGAMNRLREKRVLDIMCRYRLAAAYMLNANTEAAEKLLAGIPQADETEIYKNYPYNSWERNAAMKLETCILMERWDEASSYIKMLSEKLSSGAWMSTQSVAWSLVALSKAIEPDADGINKFSWEWLDDKQNTATNKAVTYKKLKTAPAGNYKLDFHNQGDNKLFLSLFSLTRPLPGNETAGSKNLTIEMSYQNSKGEAVDPGDMIQGLDLIITATVKNSSPYKELHDLALDISLPSGWEFVNTRLWEEEPSTSNRWDYQDIKDDRAVSYFSLAQGKDAVISISFRAHASYSGRYYLPAAKCEAMYQEDVYASTKGRWINIKAY